MSYYTNNQANVGSVNNENNGVNYVNNNLHLTNILRNLPDQPLLLQVPRLYANQRVATTTTVRRPHWQQQPPPQQINQIQQYYPQQNFVQQPLQQIYQPPLQQLPATQQPLYPQLESTANDTSSQVPKGESPSFSYSPQINEGINYGEDDGDSDNNDNGNDNNKPHNKKKKKLRRRKAKKADANLTGLPQDILNMQVKTPAQLGKYVSMVLKAMGSDNLGTYLTVNKMNYYVKTKEQQEKHILKDISFYLKPGMMCLVLGSPGGGRSSLFKVLANVAPPESKVEGPVLFNNQPINPKTHHRNISYITQNDNHMPTLTVRETLWFSSECILPASLNEATKEHRLDILLNILGLTGCQDTLVGNEFVRGISGGQKKRVTVGIDMMKGSNVYFLDEPTTGLDSVTSLEILSCVKALALSSHVGVLCALLQPPKEVFDLFDHVLILNSGQISYFGPSENAVPYFENLGLKKPEHMNPAEFLQEVCVVPDDFAENPDENELKTPEQFGEVWLNSREHEEIMEFVSNPGEFIPEEVLASKPTIGCGTASSQSETYVISPRKQLQLCMWRSYKMSVRNYISVVSRVINLLVVALVLGTLFLDLDNDQAGLSHRTGLVYYAFLTILFSSFVTIRDLYDQRPIFYEQRDQRKWYTTLPYFISYITPELVVGLICCVLFTVTLYWLAGLNVPEGRLIYFLLNLFLTELFGASFLIAISAMTSSSLYASVIVPSVLMLFILASGFTIPGNQIPGWWIWLYWASPVRWCYEGLLINEIGGENFRCTASESFPYPGTAPGFTGESVCGVTQGNQFIASLGFNTNFWWRWVDLAVLGGFCVLCFVVAFFSLKYIILQPAPAVMVKNKQKKSKTQKNKERTEKAETVVDISRKGGDNPLTIYGCHLVFKDLSYFVHVKKQKDSDGETPQSDKSEHGEVDAQGNRMMGSVNASTHKTEASKPDEIRLLNGITGYAKPGKLLALMGPSGAGKSTLLDVLADRKNSGRITGDITINGKPRDKYFTRYAAYVTQTDVLFPTSTVREAITFSARCRLPAELSDETKLNFVDSIISDLHLTNIANSAIGTLGSGITLEQRKRVNIAVELAANPQMLFLDEPTSGLDSAGARKVMKYVKKLSRQGRTIICTIHQPSSEIFKMFDQLLLLTQSGDAVYFGDINEKIENEVEVDPNEDEDDSNKTAQSLLAYCAKFGYEMEKERNPADFALEFATATNRLVQSKKEMNDFTAEQDSSLRSEVDETNSNVESQADSELTLSPDTPARQRRPVTPISPLSNAPNTPNTPNTPRTPVASSSRRAEEVDQPEAAQDIGPNGYVDNVDQLVEAYYQSELYREAVNEVENLQPVEFRSATYKGTYASNFSTQLTENIKRSLVSAVIRRKTEFFFIIGQNLFLGLFLGTIFLSLGDGQDSVRNRVSLIFFSTNFAGFIGFSQIAPVSAERSVFYHEQAAGSYRPLAYGIGLILSNIPVAIFAVLAYSVPAYWIPDLEPRHDWHRFLFFCFVFLLTALVFIALSVSLAVACPNEGIAVMILGIVIPLFTLFGGFLIPRDQIPGWWIWAYWLSAIHYPVEAMQLNTLGGLTFTCDDNELVPLVNADGSIYPYCPITSADQVFEQYGLLTNWKWIDVGVLAGGYFLFVALTLFSLAKIRHEKT